jgi:hypothetical protein
MSWDRAISLRGLEEIFPNELQTYAIVGKGKSMLLEPRKMCFCAQKFSK